VANIHELDRIVWIAARDEDDDATDGEITDLSGVATSPGGATPAADVRREDGRSRHCVNDPSPAPHGTGVRLDSDRRENALQ